MPSRKPGVAVDTPVFAAKAELFRTLAHPMRIRALEVLTTGERAVGELAAEIDADPAHLSQQLGVLRRAAIVGTRRQGTTVYYSIKDPLLVDVLDAARRLLIASLSESATVLASLKSSRRRR
jgi:DNA-binding transcriptional ArsR family regulator